MGFHWLSFVHLGILSMALVLATWIRSRLPFFQRYLIPNSLTAGFLLLLFYNPAARRLGLDTAPLGDLIYHLLSISFIAMSLRALRRMGRRKMLQEYFCSDKGKPFLTAFSSFARSFLFCDSSLANLTMLSLSLLLLFWTSRFKH
jgi:hypothetical protein